MFKYENEIKRLVGKRLKDWSTAKGIESIDQFSKLYNNGKQHKNFSAYLKGKNLRFDTLVKFGNLTFGDIALFLEFNRTIKTGELNLDKIKLYSVQHWHSLFTSNIIKHREEIYKTQLDFEIATGLERGNLAHYETGKTKPSLVKIGFFADTFSVEPHMLFRKKKI